MQDMNGWYLHEGDDAVVIAPSELIRSHPYHLMQGRVWEVDDFLKLAFIKLDDLPGQKPIGFRQWEVLIIPKKKQLDE